MLKVAIVGCGKIADAHASQILTVEGCEIVGVCDREQLMARQLADRFRVKGCFAELAELVLESRPDVVHVTTPPESHFEIARFCLEHDCHVYVEKPFTLNTESAQRLISLANQKGLKLTVGHNGQFSHVARRMRALIATGYLGGPPVHMESYYGYDLGDPSYAGALLGDNRHWVRGLPGKLLHNIIGHGIARISEFLTSDNPQVIACGFVSPLLQEMGETGIVDELRVIVAGKQTTAYFTFSSQMRPSLHEFRIYGPKNGLILDQNHELLLRLVGETFKGYADYFVSPVGFATQLLGNLFENGKLVLARDFHVDSGMKYLIETFYRSIREDVPLPIPYREILLTTRIMDAIFNQLSAGLRKTMADSYGLETVADDGERNRYADEAPLPVAPA
jgi:predicted dehydrogenase